MTFTLLGACATRPPEQLARPTATWEAHFQHPVSYHKIVGDDLLVVGTTRNLFGLDPRTGERRWRLRNVNTNARDVIDLPDSPFVLVNDAGGGAFDDRDTYILAVDRLTGRLYWESPVLNGRVLQATLDPYHHFLYVVTVRNPHGDDAGLFSDILPNKGLFSGFEREPALAAIDLSDGTVLWQRKFGREVLMRPSIRPGAGGSGAAKGARPFDLDLYHAPVLAGDQVCVTYAGIHCYAIDSGTPTWSRRFDVIEDELSLSYPRPVVAPELMIAGSTERLYAFDPDNGQRQWRSKKLGRMPELMEDQQVIYAQVGGRYFELDREEWVSKGDFAVAAIDRGSGRVLWRYGRVQRSISNLMMLGGYLCFADDEHLFVLDRTDGRVVTRAPHRLAEPPVYALLNEQLQVVLIGEREAAAYNPGDGKLLWYHEYAPPGPGPFKRLAAALLTASGNLFKLSSIAIDLGALSGRGTGLAEDVTGSIGKRLTEQGEDLGAVHGFANLSGDTQYFLTRVSGVDEVVLAAVDIDSGVTHRFTVLPWQTPNMVIDEINGQVYQASDKTLAAVPLGD